LHETYIIYFKRRRKTVDVDHECFWPIVLLHAVRSAYWHDTVTWLSLSPSVCLSVTKCIVAFRVGVGPSLIVPSFL